MAEAALNRIAAEPSILGSELSPCRSVDDDAVLLAAMAKYPEGTLLHRARRIADGLHAAACCFRPRFRRRAAHVMTRHIHRFRASARAESRVQNSEIRKALLKQQKSEIRNQKSEKHSLRASVAGRTRQKSEIRNQNILLEAAEIRQKSEIRNQKSEKPSLKQ